MRLHGSITALTTPFSASGEVDYGAWNTLLSRQIAGGTQALVVAGSTGEAAMLQDAEYARLVSSAATVAGSQIPVLAGAGHSATDRTVRQCRFAMENGAAAALVVTPPYVRPPQEGLYRHFMEVADQAGLPVVLYNVPSRTGCDLLPETVARLVTHPNIIGIKEARPEAERMQALLALADSGFAVVCGDDPSACRSLLQGAVGVISVASNVAPASLRRLADLAREGQQKEARSLETELQPLFDFLGCEPNPIPAKALLARLGLCQDALRLPLVPLSAPARAALDTHVRRIQELEARSLAALAA